MFCRTLKFYSWVLFQKKEWNKVWNQATKPGQSEKQPICKFRKWQPHQQRSQQQYNMPGWVGPKWPTNTTKWWEPLAQVLSIQRCKQVKLSNLARPIDPSHPPGTRRAFKWKKDGGGITATTPRVNLGVGNNRQEA